MLTVEKLDRYGADTKEGISRCVNLTDFYLELVNSSIDDSQIEMLEKSLSQGDLDKAFECAYGLKVVYANLALTPILKPVSEMTELLRAKTQMDYSQLMKEIIAAYEELKSLAE